MPSCAGTGIVTTCMLTRVIRSTTGISIVRPGRRTSRCARPSRNTTPRSICWTTRTLAAHADDQTRRPARRATFNTTSMTTSRNGRGLDFERTPQLAKWCLPNSRAIGHNVPVTTAPGKHAGARTAERPVPVPRARRSARGVLLVLALGTTLCLVAWGYLVWAAIGFGREARGGESSAWTYLGLASLGAIACPVHRPAARGSGAEDPASRLRRRARPATSRRSPRQALTAGSLCDPVARAAQEREVAREPEVCGEPPAPSRFLRDPRSMPREWDLKCRFPAGLVRPVRVDPTGITGPTPHQARGPSWRRTSHGFYVPAGTGSDLPEQRILEASVQGFAGQRGYRLGRGAAMGRQLLRRTRTRRAHADSGAAGGQSHGPTPAERADLDQLRTPCKG